jgi:hypothetical protein
MHSRILLLTEHFPPHVGGVPRWLYNVYSRLEDYFVTVLTGADNVIRCPHLEVISIHVAVAFLDSLELRELACLFSLTLFHFTSLLPHTFFGYSRRSLYS